MSRLARARAFGHAVTKFPFRRTSVKAGKKAKRDPNKISQSLYWCESYHQASNCVLWRKRCSARVKAAPSPVWWEKFAKYNGGFRKLADLAGISEGCRREVMEELRSCRKGKPPS